jgi:metallo-beta-lactamase class B
MTETKLDFGTPLWEPPPKRDLSANNGDTVSLGGT